MTKIFKTLLVLFFLSSCEKEDNSIKMVIKGSVRDRVTENPLPDIPISIDGVKSSSSMGLSNGIRKQVGFGKSDKNGFYRIELSLFKEATRIEFFFNNPLYNNPGYQEGHDDISLSLLKRDKENIFDLVLDPK